MKLSFSINRAEKFIPFIDNGIFTNPSVSPLHGYILSRSSFVRYIYAVLIFRKHNHSLIEGKSLQSDPVT